MIELSEFSNEIVSIQKDINTREEQEPSISRQTNPGPDYKPPVKQPIKFHYCRLDESELIRKKDVESDFNEGVYFQVYKCPTCLENYKGLDSNNLKMVRDPSIEAIVEYIETP